MFLIILKRKCGPWFQPGLNYNSNLFLRTPNNLTFCIKYLRHHRALTLWGAFKSPAAETAGRIIESSLSLDLYKIKEFSAHSVECSNISNTKSVKFVFEDIRFKR